MAATEFEDPRSWGAVPLTEGDVVPMDSRQRVGRQRKFDDAPCELLIMPSSAWSVAALLAEE